MAVCNVVESTEFYQTTGLAFRAIKKDLIIVKLAIAS